MGLRESFNEALKAAMKAGDAARTSSLRMILARLKETDIAARTQGPSGGVVGDEAIQAMLRGMIKPRQESAALYRQGKRPELAAKEEAEIAVIEEFLPPGLEGEALDRAVEAAVRESGATSAKDMGKVMAALKAAHGASIDLGRAGPLVRARLAG
ncbi:MAG TPA: GatB/YqeY domain-containing protein [Acetobacteraceae bacterium]|nr:GatB/YqeY domain-containing protein [Acetobacteraceae bacterium]